MWKEAIDKETVLIVGYDMQIDPEFQFCAIFRLLKSEKSVLLVERHTRKYGDPVSCFVIENLKKESRERFDKEIVNFWKAAMSFFKLPPLDHKPPRKPKLVP